MEREKNQLKIRLQNVETIISAILFSFASFSRIEIVSFLIKWLQRDGLEVTAQQLTAGQIFITNHVVVTMSMIALRPCHHNQTPGLHKEPHTEMFIITRILTTKNHFYIG